MAKRNAHIGGTLDDLLREDGVLEEVSARAIKRVLAWQLHEAMKARASPRPRWHNAYTPVAPCSTACSMKPIPA